MNLPFSGDVPLKRMVAKRFFLILKLLTVALLLIRISSGGTAQAPEENDPAVPGLSVGEGGRLLLDNPDPINVVSIHMYGIPERFGETPSVAEFLSLTERITDRAQKPLFVGEFGVKGKGPEVKKRFRTYLQALEQSGVSLAALWVYDFGRHHSSEPWNVTL